MMALNIELYVLLMSQYSYPLKTYNAEWKHMLKITPTSLFYGHRGSTVVKVLCYKSEGRWFDPS